MIEKEEYPILDAMLVRYPALSEVREQILAAYNLMRGTYENGGKLLIAGNGGSASDAEHMAAELMKKFKIPRNISINFKEKLKSINLENGKYLADSLEEALPAIPITAFEALSSAFANDVNSECVIAQKLYALGNEGDIFVGISTSGNSKNIVNAAITAKAMNIEVVSLTGRSGGLLNNYSDVVIKVPEDETYLIQEYHLPVYHCLCSMLENYFF